MLLSSSHMWAAQGYSEEGTESTDDLKEEARPCCACAALTDGCSVPSFQCMATRLAA